MQRYFDVVQTTAGNAIPGALVYVYVGSTTVLATLFADNGVTAAPNPLTTNADGEYAFYAANGTYTLQIVATGYAGETKPGVVLFDPSDSGASNNVQFLQAGTGAQVRSVQSKLRDVVSVKDFGAVGDGITDDTLAFQRAFNYANSVGGGTVYMPPGRYRKADTAGSTWVMYSNTTLAGAGAASVIFFDDKDTVARSGNDMLYFNNVTNIAFDNFKIEGTALVYPNETNQKQCLTGENVVGLRVTNLIIEKLRYMATAFGYAKNVYMAGNQLDYIIRDGLRAVNSEAVVITNNILRRVADDAIAVHSLDAAALPSAGIIITNNTLEACQGIKVLGAKFAIIKSNIIRRSLRGPIDVEVPATGIEGNSQQFSIEISDNNISDTFGNIGTNYSIMVRQALGRSAGGLATFPGINAVPYPYNYLNNLDSGTPVILGQFGVRICNNTITRTLPDNVLYSSWGYGLMFDRLTPGLFSDPTVTSAYFQTHGVTVVAPVTSMQIIGNNISGTGTGFAGILLTIAGTSNVQDIASATIQSNVLFDCPGVGIQLASAGSGVGAKQIVIQNNTFNLDPFFRMSAHNADNTWATATSATAIYTVSTIGLIASGNMFSNCSTTGLSQTDTQESYKNIVYSDFVAAGDNASNKGVRNLPPARTNVIIPITGDPTLTTFGQIKNVVLMQSTTLPSSGYYVLGHYVEKTNPTVAGTAGSQYIILGWTRLTTGNSHVLNTDWVEARVLTGT
jgi:hypothetical protein